MERYDFRINAEIAGEVGAEIDKLETRQLLTIHKAIQDTKDLTEEERKQLYETWFRNAILPALKEFSELTSSCLEIEFVSGVIQVAIRNAYGLDITESCHGLHMALVTAAYITINQENGDAVLGLVYDPKKFV